MLPQQWQDADVSNRQPHQRFIAIAGQEESREVGAEATPLDGMGEGIIEACGVLLERAEDSVLSSGGKATVASYLC